MQKLIETLQQPETREKIFKWAEAEHLKDNAHKPNNFRLQIQSNHVIGTNETTYFIYIAVSKMNEEDCLISNSLSIQVVIYNGFKNEEEALVELNGKLKSM